MSNSCPVALSENAEGNGVTQAFAPSSVSTRSSSSLGDILLTASGSASTSRVARGNGIDGMRVPERLSKQELESKTLGELKEILECSGRPSTGG